ncbi:MAG: BAPKO_0422 family outer member beta-barrel protein [Spirochaetota bacterium]
MKKRAVVVLLVIILFLLSPPVFAEGDVGVGFILGNPTGFSMVIADRISLGIGWGLTNYFHLNTDVWLIDRELENDVDWHVGIGGKMKVFNENTDRTYSQQKEDADLAAGVRFPVAIQYPLSPRVELFGEAAPGVEVYPAFGLDIDVGLGLRYRL